MNYCRFVSIYFCRNCHQLNGRGVKWKEWRIINDGFSFHSWNNEKKLYPFDIQQRPPSHLAACKHRCLLIFVHVNRIKTKHWIKLDFSEWMNDGGFSAFLLVQRISIHPFLYLVFHVFFAFFLYDCVSYCLDCWLNTVQKDGLTRMFGNDEQSFGI